MTDNLTDMEGVRNDICSMFLLFHVGSLIRNTSSLCKCLHRKT